MNRQIGLVKGRVGGAAVGVSGLPLTEAQRVELDRRLKAHAKNPQDVETWREVKSKIRQRK